MIELLSLLCFWIAAGCITAALMLYGDQIARINNPSTQPFTGWELVIGGLFWPLTQMLILVSALQVGLGKPVKNFDVFARPRRSAK